MNRARCRTRCRLVSARRFRRRAVLVASGGVVGAASIAFCDGSRRGRGQRGGRTARACWRKRWSFWRQFGGRNTGARSGSRLRSTGPPCPEADGIERWRVARAFVSNRWLLKVCGPLLAAGAIACFALDRQFEGNAAGRVAAFARRPDNHGTQHRGGERGRRTDSPDCWATQRYFLTPENSTTPRGCARKS